MIVLFVLESFEYLRAFSLLFCWWDLWVSGFLFALFCVLFGVMGLWFVVNVFVVGFGFLVA